MIKKCFYFGYLCFLFSCKYYNSEKTDLNTLGHQIVISNQKFKSEKAKTLNDEAVDYGKNGFSKKSKELLSEALEIEPDNPTILNNLGLANRYLGNYNEAISLFKHSLKVSDSTYLIAGLNLSLEYSNIGEYKKGIDMSNYVIERSHNKHIIVGARIHKSFSLISLGLCEKAKTELKIIKSYLNEIDNLQVHIYDLEVRIKNCDN
ncbi:MAG: tetratricopeptide repeat protein [Flavobacteriaceae bacterium]|nr:tetratricopeptide repeat protein [Flavobacteriaceae bacterium]